MRYFDCLSDKQTAGSTYNKKKHSEVCPKKDTYLFTSGAFTLMPCGVNNLFSKNDFWYNIHHDSNVFHILVFQYQGLHIWMGPS